jgi:cytochrome c oxidase cbb3-type subunit III
MIALLLSILVFAQAPSVGPRPNVGPLDRPLVDPVAADRGRRVYAVECVTCHGASARGSERGVSLVRSLLVLEDRQGSRLGPFLKAGHPTQSGTPSANLPATDAADLMHFLRQRINDTLRGSPLFTVQNILTGDPAAGEAYFNGEGRCTTCHSVTGDLAKVSSRIPLPVDLQQRMLFPVRGRGARGGGAAPAAPTRTAIAIAITPATGPALSGVLVEEDDFYVTYRDQANVVRVVKRTPGMKVVKTDPLREHQLLLDRITDKNIHDLVAYLEKLK